MDRWNWWDAPSLRLGVVLLVALPFLVPTVPPLMDLPGHMASYKISLDGSSSPTLSRYYSYNWALVGNLGVDGLVYVLARLIGIEAAAKASVILIVTASAAGFLGVAKQVHGRVPATAFFALPLIYNYSLMFGFVNYCLSAAIAFLGFWLWIKLTVSDRWLLRSLAFLAVAMLAWFAHAIGWIMLGTMCGAWMLHRYLSAENPLPRAFVRTVLTCLPLCLPAVVQLTSPAGGELQVSDILNLRMLAQWVIMLVRDRWLVWDILSAFVLLAVVGLSLIRFGGLRLNPQLGWPALALLLLFVFGPRSVNVGSDFVNSRLFAFACAVAILGIDTSGVRRDLERILATAAIAFLTLRLAGHTISFAAYDRLFEEQLQALDSIPEGSRVAAFSGVPCRSSLANWYSPRLKHLSGMAVIRKESFVNSIWTVPGLHVLQVHYPEAGRFQSDPSGIVNPTDCPGSWVRTLNDSLRELPMHAFDRVWLLDIPRRHWPSDPRLTLIWSGPDAAVFAINRNAR